MKYVLDTCVFNWLLDGQIDFKSMPSDGEYVATHVQLDEINKTTDSDRRVRLMMTFAKVRPEIVATETFILGVSRLDNAKPSSGDVYSQLKGSLDLANKSKPNNAMDALIAEVAYSNGYTLITTDRDLRTAAEGLGCKVLLFERE